MAQLGLLPIMLLAHITRFVGVRFVLWEGPQCSKHLQQWLCLHAKKRCWNITWFVNSLLMTTLTRENCQIRTETAVQILPMIQKNDRHALFEHSLLLKFKSTEIVKWHAQLHKIKSQHIQDFCSHIFRNACASGNYALIKWYVMVFHLTWNAFANNNFIAFDLACINSEADDVIEWMVYEILPPYVNILTHRATRMNFTHNRGGQSSPYLCRVPHKQGFTSLQKHITTRAEKLSVLQKRLARFRLDLESRQFKSEDDFFLKDYVGI